MLCYPTVTATVFHRFMDNGRTQPALFTCKDADGVVADYVVKFYGRLQSGAICELLASTLGVALGIPVPPGTIVAIDERFAIIHTALAGALASGIGPHFGSRYFGGGFSIFSGHYAIPNTLLPAAIDIFAWDMLLLNYDRKRVNPNLLSNGEQFLVLDHDLALGFDRMLGEPQDLLVLRNSTLAREHVLYLGLHGHIDNTSFDGFVSRLAALPPDCIEQLVAALPAAWQNARLTTAIIRHFATVQRDLGLFRQSLLGVFV